MNLPMPPSWLAVLLCYPLSPVFLLPWSSLCLILLWQYYLFLVSICKGTFFHLFTFNLYVIYIRQHIARFCCFIQCYIQYYLWFLIEIFRPIISNITGGISCTKSTILLLIFCLSRLFYVPFSLFFPSLEYFIIVVIFSYVLIFIILFHINIEVKICIVNLLKLL